MTSNAKTSPRSAEGRNSPADQPNPKVNPDPSDNQIKDPAEWVSGHDPMTGAQASYLKTLSEQAHEPKAFDPNLDKAEASKRIDQLKQGQDR